MNENSKFIKERVLHELGGVKNAAQFFKCQRQAIYMWPDGEAIPKLRQLQLELAMPEIFGTPKAA